MSAPRARELLNWLDKHQANGNLRNDVASLVTQGHGPPTQGKTKGLTRISTWKDRLGAASNAGQSALDLDGFAGHPKDRHERR